MKKTRGKKKISSNKIVEKKKSFRFKDHVITYYIVIALVLILGIVLFLKTSPTGNAITGDPIKSAEINSATWEDVSGFLAGYPPLAKLLMYIFGNPVDLTGKGVTNLVACGIITIAVWLLIFITFSDIIASFSSFNKWVAWVIGFLISVIAANLGTIVSLTAWVTGFFAGFGVITVYAGLIIAFVAFLAINIGVGNFARWALNRRAVMTAHQAAAGGKKAAGAVEGIGEIGEALAKLARK